MRVTEHYCNAGGNPNPFTTPADFPGVAFFTNDQNLFSQQPNNLIIVNYNYDTFVSSVTSSYYSYTCFKEGSKILTEHGYKPIEQLRKGDKVMTYYHGLKAIDMIGRREIYHPANKEERIQDQLYTCSPSAYPELTEDLVLTGAHSILVADFGDEEQKKRIIEVNGDLYVTDGKGRLPACVDERATVFPIAGTYMIYHFALEHDNYYMNYGVYANGLLVETCSKRYMKELSGMTLIE
jgi:Hint domain